MLKVGSLIRKKSKRKKHYKVKFLERETRPIFNLFIGLGIVQGRLKIVLVVKPSKSKEINDLIWRKLIVT